VGWVDSYSYTKQISSIQIELSSVCNSLCLGCVRTDPTFNKSKDFIPKDQYLDIECLLSIFETKKGKQIKRVEFCGNIDEPLAHPHFLDLLQRLNRVDPELIVHIHTNGSIRNKGYHESLAQIIKGFAPISSIRYGIDGLSGTHEIYRQNTSFQKSFENMVAACSTGARVIWQYLVFPWNMHQVEEAKVLAKEVGCKEIWFRPDRSEATRLGYEKIQKIKLSPEMVGNGAAASSPSFEPIPGEGHEIDCKFITDGESTLFINWRGEVWPCCFHANVFYENTAKQEAFYRSVLRGYEEGFNSIKKNNFDQICEHPFFSEHLKKSWDDSHDIRRWRCYEKCRKGKKRSSDNKIETNNNSGIIRHRL
jgi:MoaA/NifB/PqqE/SkfB family radical SAM enzyme